MTLLQVLTIIMIFLKSDNYYLFMGCCLLLQASLVFVDTLAEGMTAMLTKMKERLRKLKQANGDLVETRSSLGFFMVFRTLIMNLSIFGGSILPHFVPARWVFLVFLIVPVALLGYTLIIFREKKREEAFAGCLRLGDSFNRFGNMVVTLPFLLPIFLQILLRAVPDLADPSHYIILNTTSFRVSEFGLAKLLSGVVYSLTMLVFLRKILQRINFEKSFLVSIGFLVIRCALFFSLLYVKNLDVALVFVVVVTLSLLLQISKLFSFIALVGRVSQYSPGGFEVTAVTFCFSINNFGNFLGGIGAAWEMEEFNVHNGFYQRIQTPLLLNLGISIAVLALCPFLVCWQISKKNRIQYLSNADQEGLSQNDLDDLVI